MYDTYNDASSNLGFGPTNNNYVFCFFLSLLIVYVSVFIFVSKNITLC